MKNHCKAPTPYNFGFCKAFCLIWARPAPLVHLTFSLCLYVYPLGRKKNVRKTYHNHENTYCYQASSSEDESD